MSMDDLIIKEKRIVIGLIREKFRRIIDFLLYYITKLSIMVNEKYIYVRVKNKVDEKYKSYTN